LSVEKADRCLEGVRYDWITGRTGDNGRGPSGIKQYLAHADNVLLWLLYFPRWVNDDLLDHLDVPALDDITLAVRLANDLDTYS
jgi:uncharacterized membrane-anchored protein